MKWFYDLLTKIKSDPIYRSLKILIIYIQK